MPRKRQPPRLYYYASDDVWLIRDGSTTLRTGCRHADSRGAEKALAEYLAAKYRPIDREHNPDRLSVAEVLAAYGSEHIPGTSAASRESAGYNIAALLRFWGNRPLTDVRGVTCRDYTRQRMADGLRAGSVRREMATLQASINYWHREHGPLTSVPVVTLPPKPEPRPHWLTRTQAAHLLAGALGWYRVRFTDIRTRQEHVRWRRDLTLVNRDLARFIILALATGTRHAAVLAVQWFANTTGGSIDLDAGVMHRRGSGSSETRKRRPPVRLGTKTLSHLRRWHAIDMAKRDAEAAATGETSHSWKHVVTYEGAPIQKMRKPWYAARDLAELGREVTPHILRHTRVTWWVEAGLSLEEVADAAGMTVKMVEDIYWHRSPHFQKKASEA